MVLADLGLAQQIPEGKSEVPLIGGSLGASEDPKWQGGGSRSGCPFGFPAKSQAKKGRVRHGKPQNGGGGGGPFGVPKGYGRKRVWQVWQVWLKTKQERVWQVWSEKARPTSFRCFPLILFGEILERTRKTMG